MMMPALIKVKAKEIIKETKDTITLITDKPENFEYFAGQFATIDTRQFKELENIEEGRRAGPRAYSFTSSPTESHLALTIKEEEGGKFSPWLLSGGIKTGDFIELRGPHGHFIYKKEMGGLVLIGAGSGIVPLRSILKYVVDSGFKISVKLFYSNKTKEDIIYKKELDKFSKLHDVEVIYNLTREEWEEKTGRIDEEHLSKHIEDFSKYYYFLCGPNDFCNTLREILVKKGVRLQKFKMEKYG